MLGGKSLESRNKYLAKNTLIFTIGNFGSKFIAFFLVPLYTNVLRTEEYGVADLITTLCAVIAPALILNISEAIVRFSLDKDADRAVITKIGIRVFEISIILGIVLIPVYNLFSSVRDYSIYIFVYNIAIGASTIFLYDLRGKELLLQYSIGSVILTLTSALFNILFLVVLDWGIQGYISAFILANFLTAVYAAVVGRSFKDYSKTKINIEKMKEMVSFSAFLIPNTFMWWIMNSSDRVMVTAMVGNAANGIYAISYKLPTLISTLTGIFNQAWGYSAIRENGAKDESEYNNEVFRSLISIAMLMGVGLITVMKPFLDIYVEKSYYVAWKYTPFLVIGCVYLTLGTFMSSTYNVHKDSKGFLLSGTIGAVVNIGLNFLLIPKFQVYGAAIATCISYIVVFLFRYFHTRKYICFNIKNKEFIIGTVLLLSSSVIMFIDNYIGLTLQILILAITMIVYANYWTVVLRGIINKFMKRKVD